jgi:hypothetical protein
MLLGEIRNQPSQARIRTPVAGERSAIPIWIGSRPERFVYPVEMFLQIVKHGVEFTRLFLLPVNPAGNTAVWA